MTLRNNILLAAIRKISWRHQNRIARLNRLIRYADLRHANLRHANLVDADLSYANLVGANLFDADLSYADLVDANLVGANLVDANLRHANLVDADLRHANLFDADLSYAWMRETKFSYSNLSGVKGIKYAQLSTHHHGEMDRSLTAVEQQGQLTIHCGCFNSFEDAEQELRQYIANGDEELKASRTFHLDMLLQLYRYQQEKNK